MNICYVLEHGYPNQGGVEIAFFEIAKRLAERNHAVTILTSESGGLKGKKEFNKVKYHYFPWLTFFNHPIPKREDIEPFIKKADIVHTSTYTAAPLANMVARKYHKPCIVTVHEVLGKKWFWVEKNPAVAGLFYLFEQYVIHQDYSFYHAVSLATRDDLVKSGIPEKKIKVVYHGVGDEFRRISQKTLPYFLYYGRPGKTKGVTLLLKAISLIKHKLPDNYYFLFILSRKPLGEYKNFIQLIEKYNLQNKITVINSLPKKELTSKIVEAYCVIVPSITEGFGFSAAEASTMRKPIIISDAGSLPEVASGKVLQFKNKDINDLAQKLILATENKFVHVSQKEFYWDDAVNKIEKIYENCSHH